MDKSFDLQKAKRLSKWKWETENPISVEMDESRNEDIASRLVQEKSQKITSLKMKLYFLPLMLPQLYGINLYSLIFLLFLFMILLLLLKLNSPNFTLLNKIGVASRFLFFLFFSLILYLFCHESARYPSHESLFKLEVWM